MKNYLIYSSAIILIALVFLFPEICSNGVALGINLIVNSLIPAILPFIIISNYLIKSGCSTGLGKIFYSLTRHIFPLSPNGTYAFIMGLLCGYPIGAKIVADLEKSNMISSEEARYLFKYTNHVSPAFVQGYLILFVLNSNCNKSLILLLIYAPEIILAILSKPSYNFPIQSVSPAATKNTSSPDTLFDISFYNGVKAILKVSGYVIIFSVLICFINEIWFLPEIIKVITVSICEITSGLYCISNYNTSPFTKELLCIIFTIFGGISSFFQIKSVTKGTSFSTLSYFITKAKAMVIAVIILILFNYVY